MHNNKPSRSIITTKVPILIILTIILLIGAFLRLHQLNTLPPGLFMDEAVNGIDAQDIWRNGRFSIFFPDNNGREPIYIYLLALLMGLIGERAFTIRIASVYCGILTIPLAYVLAKTLFRKDKTRAIYIGLVAAAVLATSFWHVSLSRLGFRTILLPFFVMLAILWFWQGWQKKQMRWFALAGIAIGLTQYTYLAARAMPAIFIIFLVVIFLLSRILPNQQFAFKPLVKGTLIATLFAVVVFLPLAVYFYTNPANVSARTEDVSILSAAVDNNQPVALALINNTISVTRMFIDQGDLVLRNNLPNRPIFDLLNSIGFFTGIIVLLWRWRQPQFWLLSIWLSVMLLPTLLATDAPQYLRPTGAIGAIVTFVSIGLVWWWDKLVSWVMKNEWFKRPYPLWLLLPILITSVSGLITSYDYFVRWGQHESLYDAFEGLELEAAKFALQKQNEGHVYLIPELIAQRSPVLQFFIPHSEVQPVPANCFVYQPQATEPIIYLIRTQRDETTLPQLQTIVPNGIVEKVVYHPISGEIFFKTYTVFPDENATPLPETAVAQFSNTIQLHSSDIQQDNNAIHLTTTWHTLQQPPPDHTLFIHLYRQGEEDQAPVAQIDVQPCYPTSHWQASESLQETYTLPYPPDLPPGDYTLALGWYTWPSFERLTLTQSENTLSDQRLSLGHITITD